MKFRYIAAVLIAASLVTILPMLLLSIAGDWMEQSAFIQCFGSQFWQGDLYPRWCFNVNDGLGAPFFLFYFPLPFYISSLLYPLTWLGVGIYPLFVICCFLATLATAFAAYSWLKDIVAPKYALLAVILLLLTPYRMELLLYRIAYSELWAVALIPLLFKYLRRLALGQSYEWRKLAWIWGALGICHLPAFFATAVGSTIYMAVMARARVTLWIRYALAFGCGVLLAAFYIVPAWYYKRYIFAENVMAGSSSWSIDFLSPSLNKQSLLTAMLLLTIVALVAAAVWSIVKRGRIEDSVIRREILAWSAILAGCLFLIFPVSSFFYAWLGPLGQIAQPRRMQSLLILCTGYFSAIILYYFSSAKKTWKADYGLLVAFLILGSYAVTGVPTPETEKMLPLILRNQCVVYTGYRPRWVDPAHWSIDYVLRHAQEKPPKVTIIAGKGEVQVEHWQWSGIVLSTHSSQNMRLRLDHTYFPVWQAVADGKTPVALSPEKGSGQIVLDVPPDAHHILLRPSMFAQYPWLMYLSWMVSLATALALGWLSLMHSFDKRKSACYP